MKSKYNPLIFRSLATGAALFAIAPLHAAEFDTTGTTVTLSPENRYIGNGTLQISGGGAVWLGNGGGVPNTEFAMTGGVIDIVSGTSLMNGGWAKGKWGENKASLQVNGTFDLLNGEWVGADALTGSGTVTMTYTDGWYTAGLVLGLNNGGGTFTGAITDYDNGIQNIQLHKYGTGTQILTGTNTYSSSTVIGGGTLQLGNGTDTGSLSSSSAISVGSGATFVINQSDTVTQGTDFSSAGISGAGGFTQAGAGTTVLNASNTYTGATTINGGTLTLQGAAFSTTARAYSIASGAVLNLDGSTGVASGNTTISGSGTLRISGGGLVSGADDRDLTLALGSGALIEIQSGASIYNGGWQNMIWTNNLAGLQVNGTFEMGDGNNIFADALTGSGTVAVSGSGYYTLNQLITVGVNGGGGTFSGTIFDSDSDDDTVSLIKTGVGTQILTGTNNYAGSTTVNGGTLQLGDGINNTGLADTADVTVDSGCTLNLNYTGTDTIDELWLGGVQKSPGTYNSSNSGGLITGTGSLVVQNGPSADPFANWMTTNYPGILTPDNEPGADPDNDGIANLMEYVLQGGDPSVSTTGTLPTLDASGANFVFTYYRRAAATGTTQTFEYSTTLGAGSWTQVAIPGGAGVVVNDQGAGVDKVEITVAKGAETKLFGRLQVLK